MRSRRVLACALVVAVLLVVVAILLVYGDLEPEPGQPGRRESPPPAEDNRAEVAATETDRAFESRPGSISLRLIDLHTLRPIPHVPVRADLVDAPGISVLTRSDDSGRLRFALPGAMEIAIPEGPWKLVRPDTSYAAEEQVTEIEDVYAYRTITVLGHISFENPSCVTEDTPAVVVAGPIHHSPEEIVTDPERIGSPAWIDVNARHLSRVRTTTGKMEFRFEVPAIGRVGVCVWAPGHLSDSRWTTPEAAGSDGEVRMRFDLRLAEQVAVKVVDENGVPVQYATLQFFALREIPFHETNMETERLTAYAADAGLAIRSRGRETGIVKLIADARSDQSGDARLQQAGPADAMYLVVLASGFAHHVQRLRAPGELDGAQIRLERLKHAHDSYSLLLDGRSVGHGSLVLALVLDGFNSALDTIPIVQGRISSRSIEPGREYVFFLTKAEPLEVLTGTIVFGEEKSIELSEWVER